MKTKGFLVRQLYILQGPPFCFFSILYFSCPFLQTIRSGKVDSFVTRKHLWITDFWCCWVQLQDNIPVFSTLITGNAQIHQLSDGIQPPLRLCFLQKIEHINYHGCSLKEFLLEKYALTQEKCTAILLILFKYPLSVKITSMNCLWIFI